MRALVHRPQGTAHQKNLFQNFQLCFEHFLKKGLAFCQSPFFEQQVSFSIHLQLSALFVLFHYNEEEALLLSQSSPE